MAGWSGGLGMNLTLGRCDWVSLLARVNAWPQGIGVSINAAAASRLSSPRPAAFRSGAAVIPGSVAARSASACTVCVLEQVPRCPPPAGRALPPPPSAGVAMDRWPHLAAPPMTGPGHGHRRRRRRLCRTDQARPPRPGCRGPGTASTQWPRVWRWMFGGRAAVLRLEAPRGRRNFPAWHGTLAGPACTPT